MMNNYIEEAHRTLQPGLQHYHNVTRRELLILLDEIYNTTVAADHFKKRAVYGKQDNINLGGENCVDTLSHINPDVFHGILGTLSEAGELMEALKNSILNKKPIDVINVKEEVGDIFWYLAILCKALGFTFEEAQELNIKKLAARYPEKYSKEKALNRDLEVERTVLES